MIARATISFHTYQKHGRNIETFVWRSQVRYHFGLLCEITPIFPRHPLGELRPVGRLPSSFFREVNLCK